MANNDSTRPDFDFSPWGDLDPLSIWQAACMWARVYPRQPNEAAWAWSRRLEKAAEAGELPHEKPVLKTDVKTSGRVIGSNYLGTPSRPATYREADDWRFALVARADLRTYAESIGQRPAFLFAETAGQQSAAADGVDLTGRVKARAAEIGKERSADEKRPSMSVIAKALESEAATKVKAGSEDAMYKGGKGAHTMSWYKNQLKGWKPEK